MFYSSEAQLVGIFLLLPALRKLQHHIRRLDIALICTVLAKKTSEGGGWGGGQLGWLQDFLAKLLPSCTLQDAALSQLAFWYCA